MMSNIWAVLLDSSPRVAALRQVGVAFLAKSLLQKQSSSFLFPTTLYGTQYE